MTVDSDTLKGLTKQIALIANRLEAIASQHPPNWQLPLSLYSSEWSERIEARIIERDEYGPSKVVWSGHTYTRRTGSHKYGAAIWFSRGTGNGNGDGEYARLITFKDSAPAEPLPEYVIRALYKR